MSICVPWDGGVRIPSRWSLSTCRTWQGSKRWRGSVVRKRPLEKGSDNGRWVFVAVFTKWAFWRYKWDLQNSQKTTKNWDWEQSSWGDEVEVYLASGYVPAIYMLWMPQFGIQCLFLCQLAGDFSDIPMSEVTSTDLGYCRTDAITRSNPGQTQTQTQRPSSGTRVEAKLIKFNVVDSFYRQL